jgi:hypothetical protein
MPILVSSLASVVLAWLRGVPPLRLAGIRLRWLALPLLAFLSQALAFGRFGAYTAPYAVWVQCITGAILLAFLVANLRYRSFALILVGVGLNLLVSTINGGYMPVRIADVERAGFPAVARQLAEEGRFQKSAVLDERTQLPWLGDAIYLPLPWGPGRMISIGDVLVAAGTFLFIQEAMLSRTD